MRIKRRFGEDNIVRTESGEVMILPSYTPNPYYPFTSYYPNPTYPFDQREYYFPERIESDYYDPLSGRIVLMDGTVLGENKFEEAISQGIFTQREIDWVMSHSRWILYGLIGLGVLVILRSRRRKIVEVQAI